MDYSLLKNLIDLAEEFETENENSQEDGKSINTFIQWIVNKFRHIYNEEVPEWEGKMNGRTPESAIATLLVHMNRFGKNYFKSAIHDSDFSTQDDVIYLIVLKFSNNMTKMDLIKKNVHEKPAGMQIINRLISNGWVAQTHSKLDKRSKVLNITEKGLFALETIMNKVRQATDIVSGNLSYNEKIELIRLLNKLNDFHQPIYDTNIDLENLLNEASKSFNK